MVRLEENKMKKIYLADDLLKEKPEVLEELVVDKDNPITFTREGFYKKKLAYSYKIYYGKNYVQLKLFDLLNDEIDCFTAFGNDEYHKKSEKIIINKTDEGIFDISLENVDVDKLDLK